MKSPVSVDKNLSLDMHRHTPGTRDLLLLLPPLEKKNKRPIFSWVPGIRLAIGGNFLTILGGFAHEGGFLLLQRPPVGKEFTC